MSQQFSPLERLIRRCLKNGIKTLAGVNNQTTPAAGVSRLITYQGDRKTFLAILQFDAAHLDRSFDQGQRSEEFAAMVDQIALDIGMVS